MTVTYSEDVATANFTTLYKLLVLRWRGSLLKLIWRDLLIYLLCFFVVSEIYERLHDNERKKYGEFARKLKSDFTIPLDFMLAFYVSNVMTRWFDQYLEIPWPYSIAVYVSSNVQGFDEVGRAMRRTIMRYVCLSLTMVFRVLSPRVQERFPLMSDLVGAGLLLESELKIIEELEENYPGYSKNWLPIVWAASLVNRARSEGRIRDDFAVKTMVDELNTFRGSCGTLMNYNTICIPLVYTQIVTIAVYTYFLAGLIIYQSESKMPIIPALEFIFYMGWLKVAETMLNPFGNDDDDFEVNYLIDRNLQMSYLIVDEMHNEHPELLKDQYWDEMPQKLPGRKTSDEHRPTEPTDIFDVPEKPSGPTRRPTVYFRSLSISSLDVQPQRVHSFIPSKTASKSSLKNHPRAGTSPNILAMIPEVQIVSPENVQNSPRASASVTSKPGQHSAGNGKKED